MSLQRDFTWQAGFYPQVEKILKDNASLFVNANIANIEDDMKHATDFVVVNVKAQIALRIRRNVANSFRDLTIRSSRPSECNTELQKIKMGFVDFYLYIWTCNDKILDWWLVDIGKMRSSGLFEKSRPEIWNKDKSSSFVSFNKLELQKAGALVAEYTKIPVSVMELV